jgi:hypothetical protein
MPIFHLGVDLDVKKINKINKKEKKGGWFSIYLSVNPIASFFVFVPTTKKHPGNHMSLA